MAATPEPHLPPASDRDFSSVAWQRFFAALRNRVARAGAIVWSLIDTAGSNLTDIETRNHNDLQNRNTAEAHAATAVTYTSAGTGATARTSQAKHQETISVLDFGATGDGTTDDTAAIQAAIAYVKTLGGGFVDFPSGVFKITSTILIDEGGIYLRGQGQGGGQFGAATIRNTCATRLFWAGGASASSPIVRFRTPENGILQSGGGLSGMMLDCANAAGFGLRLATWANGDFNNLVVFGATVTAIHLTTVAYTLAAAPYDCIRNQFRNIYTLAHGYSANGSNGLRLTSNSDAQGNSCFNTFIGCKFIKGPAGTGLGIILEASDNNMFFNVVAAEMQFGSVDEDTSSYTPNPSRYNMVVASELNIIAKASQTGGASSHDNAVWGLNESNGQGTVTIETGAGGSSDATVLVHKVGGDIVGNVKYQGLVGIGVTSPVWKIDTSTSGAGAFGFRLKSSLPSVATPAILVQGDRNDGNGSYNFAGKLALAGHRTDAAVPTNKTLGSIIFGGNHTNGSEANIAYSARIAGQASGAFNSAADMPTDLVFYTGNAGVSTLFSTNAIGIAALRINSLQAVLAVSPTGGVGYGVGAGGTVTQQTSKTTAVTLNNVCGGIVMNNAALAAGATVVFTLTNSTIAATDVVICNTDGFPAENYSVRVGEVATGSCVMVVKNESAGSLSNALVVRFAVIKVVTS